MQLLKKTDKATSSTHVALEVSIDIAHKQHTTNVKRTVYNFKGADFSVVHRALACLDWSNLDKSTSVNDMLSYFNDVIFAVIKDFIPVVHINCRKYPHWYDKGIIALITEKFKCRQQFVKSGRDKTSEAHK